MSACICGVEHSVDFMNPQFLTCDGNVKEDGCGRSWKLISDHDWTRDYNYQSNIKPTKIKHKGKYGPYVPLLSTRPEKRRAFTINHE